VGGLHVETPDGKPLAWQREPYYALLKKFSEVFFRIDQKVLVSLGGRVTARASPMVSATANSEEPP
jgi:hypothetical protein